MRITVHNIIQDDNPLIRKKSMEVSLPLSKEDESFAFAMHEYVKDSTDEDLALKYELAPAVGLAAIQVGVEKRILAIVIANEDDSLQEYILVNPKIISHSSQYSYLVGGEGCLSVEVKRDGEIYRHARITVQAYDVLQKKKVTIRAKGYLAIVMQHEMDHFDGILYYDRLETTLTKEEMMDALAIE